MSDCDEEMGNHRSRHSDSASPDDAHTNQQAPLSSDESTDFDEGVVEGGRVQVASAGDAASSSDDDTNDRSIFSAFLRNLISSGTIQLMNQSDTPADDEYDEATPVRDRNYSDVHEPAGNDEKQKLKCMDIGQQIALASGQLSSHSSVTLDDRLALRQIGLRIKSKAPTNFSNSDKSSILVNYLPNKRRVIDRHRTKTFCSQYTKSGNVLMTASQDHSIRFYRRYGGKFSLFREVQARDVGWAILDLDMSPDGRHVIYGTWSDHLHQFNVYGDEVNFETFNLESPDYRFCAFSVRFSDSGREIVAGASDGMLYVYDREAKTNLARIKGHEDDVNTVCFGDTSSNIIYSGGDDGLCKVWDRRTLRCDENPTAAGILAGHCDGVTFIDSRGDGRHLISNSKDQSIKLWDIRYLSNRAAVEETYQAVSRQNWDYRWQDVPRRARKYRRLEGDSSLMTYRGHTVLHTLVRCYFSPMHSTGQRYIYSGCARGAGVVYDLLTADIVTRLPGHKSCVRDVAWHPVENEIITSSWDGCTAVWTYDERKSRMLHPDAPDWECVGYEDTSDEEGNKFTSDMVSDMQMKQQLRDANNKQRQRLSTENSKNGSCLGRSSRVQNRENSNLLAALFAAQNRTRSDSVN